MSAPAPPPLRLLSLDDANAGPDDVIVRPQNSSMLMISVLAVGMAGWSVWTSAQGGLHWFWAALIVLALGGLARVGFRMWQRTQSPDVWQMAIGQDRVLIRYRSVMSARLPSSDAQVIELPLAMVESVRRMRRTVVEKSGEEQRRKYEYLDFLVKDCDLRPLQAALAAEQWDGASTWFRRRDPTVAVTCDGILRVETTFQASATKPPLDEILRLLARRVPRAEDARENVDLTNPARLAPGAQDDAIRAIGETNPHRALQIARQLQPDAPWEKTEQRVARLIACPDPTTVARPASSIAAPAAAAAAAAAAATTAATPVASAAADPALHVPRLLRRDEVRFAPDDRVVRLSARSTLRTALVFLALAGVVAWRWYEDAMRWQFALLLGVPLAVFGWLLLGMWLATLRRDSWLLAIGPERLLVQFRSYLHHRHPATDPVVLELPMANVTGMRRTVQTRVTPLSSGKGNRERKHTLLDLRISGLDLGPLTTALSRERALGQEGLRYEHAPVTVDGDFLRVELWSRDESTRPGLDEVMRLLAERVPVEEDTAERVEPGGARRTPAITAPETQP